PSLAMTLPVLSTTTISSDWLAATQRLSSPSITSPSAPLMLLTKMAGVPGVTPLTGICTIVSLPVLATNKMDCALLKPRPLAPNGGSPAVLSRGSCTHGVTSGVLLPDGPDFQIAP